MELDRALVAAKLRRWADYMHRYRLPVWETIPDFGLYMEQVITLLEGYLDYYPPELKEEPVVTAAAINNYVRRHMIPKPIKKRYYRVHIVYLLIICTLRQSMSITSLVRYLKPDLPEEKLRVLYETYSRRHHMTAEVFVAQVMALGAGILEEEPQVPYATDDPLELLATAAVFGCFYRLLAQKLLFMDGKTLLDVPEAERSVRPK